MLKYLCFSAVFLIVQGSSIPSFITRCNKGDNACFLATTRAVLPAFAAGIPEIGSKSLDPMAIALVKSNRGGLDLTFTNTTIVGMKGCVAENIKVDPELKKQSLTVRCTVKLTGQYKLDGRLLVLPVQGEGDYIINIRDIVIKASNEMVMVPGADGKDHLHISHWSHTYNTKSGAKFQFKNLFNGNKVLATPVEQFLNDYWREVMQEIAPPIVRAIVANVEDAVEALYKAVPAEDLLLP